MAQLPPDEVMPNRHAPTSYHQLLADRTLDAVRNNPRAFLAGYQFGNDAPVPAALLDQSVLLSDRQPMTFLVLGTKRRHLLRPHFAQVHAIP